MNLKFSFFISSLLTKGTKLKISFFLSRDTIYTYFLTIKTRHFFRLLPSTFHSFFSSLLHFSFHPRISFFPIPVIIFLSPFGRKYPLFTSFPLQIQTVPEVSIEKFVSKPFYTFLDIFTYFIYARGGMKKNSRSGVGEKNEIPLYLIAQCRFPCIFSIFRFHPLWNRDDDRYPRDSTNFSLHELAFSAFSFLYGPLLEIDILLEVVVLYKERSSWLYYL